MSTMTLTEGEIERNVPGAGKPCKTWYAVAGDLKSRTRRPLVVLHGGPGASYDYLLTIGVLATSHSIPVIFYDQVGTGRSTHLPEKKGDGSFWNDNMFLDELDAILVHFDIKHDYDILGHSWGGMLGARHAAMQPAGLKRLILSDAPSSMPLWIIATKQLCAELPPNIRDTLKKHEDNGTTHEEEYEKAVQEFYAIHLCRIQPMPEPIAKSFQYIADDPTVYSTMIGPSEMHIIGSTKDWTVIPELHRINASTLVINGRYEQAQDSVVQPFFDLIPKVKWVQFSESSHMPHYEEPERYFKIVGDFLSAGQ